MQTKHKTFFLIGPPKQGKTTTGNFLLNRKAAFDYSNKIPHRVKWAEMKLASHKKRRIVDIPSLTFTTGSPQEMQGKALLFKRYLDIIGISGNYYNFHGEVFIIVLNDTSTPGQLADILTFLVYMFTESILQSVLLFYIPTQAPLDDAEQVRRELLDEPRTRQLCARAGCQPGLALWSNRQPFANQERDVEMLMEQTPVFYRDKRRFLRRDFGERLIKVRRVVLKPREPFRPRRFTERRIVRKLDVSELETGRSVLSERLSGSIKNNGELAQKQRELVQRQIELVNRQNELAKSQHELMELQKELADSYRDLLNHEKMSVAKKERMLDAAIFA